MELLSDPKGCIYAAVAFSLVVEALNIRARQTPEGRSELKFPLHPFIN